MNQSTSEPKNVPGLPRVEILGAAALIGLLGNLFLNGSEGPGLNLFALFVLFACAMVFVTRRAGRSMSREAHVWIIVGLALASTFVLRASEGLQFFALISAAAAFAFPALRGGARWLRGCGAGEPFEAIAGAIFQTAIGPLRWILDQKDPNVVPHAPHAAHASPLPQALWGGFRGAVLSIPFLLIFGALFMSADPVFEALVLAQLGTLEVDVVLSHLVLTGLIAWFVTGSLSGLVRGTGLRGWLERVAPRPSLGVFEVTTALGLVALLFTAFVGVQLGTLFGGSALVEATAGLTYSEYAREGFGQLVVAVGFVLPLLLVSDWLLRRDHPHNAQIFQVLGGVQLGLLLIVIASAFARVRAYQDAYGLTESRLYGSVFLGWIAGVSLWFGWTLLRDARTTFAPVAVVAAFLAVAGLTVSNPDARIAQINLERSRLDPSTPLDVAYLSALSADALPTLLRALPTLSPMDRCHIVARATARWGAQNPSTPGFRGLQAWNASEARARALVRNAPDGLLSTSGCPTER